MTSPRTLTREESEQLLAALAGPPTRQVRKTQSERDHAIGIFLLETGLRVGELVRLRIRDVLFNGASVTNLVVRPEIAKLKKERVIPVSARLHTSIVTCATRLWYGHRDQPDTFLWYRSNPHAHLSTRTVESIIRTASLSALGRPVHPHVLRHTFASRMMRVTSARIVQELLGHADLRSTQIYTHPNGDDLRKAIDAAGSHQT